ncbi:MAG: hypothetical protein K2I08_06345 [Muribaculaceae bacterium]|nr:hypothetical protein [Muribaculaceae bacterium]
MARVLNEKFFKWLQTDPLNLLAIISKYDCLASHFSEGKALKVYFKGFLILTISDKIIEDNGITFKVLDSAYLKDENNDSITNIIKNGVCISNLEDYLDLVIGFLSRRKNSRVEETLRQEIAFINNRSSNANETDYFVVDEEYKINNSKFDLVTLKWRSDKNVRKNFNTKKTPLEIVIFELKQGLNAIGGSKDSTSEKSDLKKHYADFMTLMSDNNLLAQFKLDIIKMFVQQASLKCFFNTDKIKGLKHVTKLSDPWNEEEIQEMAKNSSVKFGMIISDYKQESSLLKEQIEQISGDFIFAMSSFMGYGLYENSMLNRDQLFRILK